VTFLQRLLVGWTRSRGLNLVPFSEKERTCSQTICRGSTPGAHPCNRSHPSTSAHAQGYFSATILMLVGFEQNMMNSMENDDADAQFNQDVFGPDF
jgi:hypothetical protein